MVSKGRYKRRMRCRTLEAGGASWNNIFCTFTARMKERKLDAVDENTGRTIMIELIALRFNGPDQTKDGVGTSRQHVPDFSSGGCLRGH